MANRNMYARQENIHPHANGYPPAIQGSRKTAVPARMTNSSASMVASNGVYSSETGIHPSSINVEFGMNPIPNSEVVGNPRKRSSEEPHEQPRRRAVVACELCRSRKSRCDAAKPKCKLCMEQNRECVYREPGIKLDAGDKLILAQLDRIERILQAQAPAEDPNSSVEPSVVDQGAAAGGDGFNNVDRNDRVNRLSSIPNEGFEAHEDSDLTIIKLHVAPALQILQWPKIERLISRSYNIALPLQSEMAREHLQLGDALSLEFTRNEEYIASFFHDANIWYACVDPTTWAQTYYTASSRDFREGPESCLVLLVLALGNACNPENSSPLPHDAEAPGMPYFTAALGQLPYLMMNHDMISSQCVVLASAYLLYLVRPMEAWTLLNSTLMKLKLFLSTSSGLSGNSIEISARVIWNAILLESEILEELDLPQSPLINYSSVLNTPNVFSTGNNEQPMEFFPDKFWYLQASISLRRLTTRINQTIYSASTPLSTAALEPLAKSLDDDLLAWYTDLPFAADFPPDSTSTQPPLPTAQIVLRFRYHATRALIFRPFILAAFQNPTATTAPGVRAACYACLDSCVRALGHVFHLRTAFLPSLWQGGLATVGMALLVLGARQEEGLAMLLPLDRLDALLNGVLADIEQLGSKAPSLGSAIETLAEAMGKTIRRGSY